MFKAFKEITSQIKYLWLSVCYNVKSSVSNTKSFIIQTIAMFINNFVFVVFWQILFNNKGGEINGTGMEDIWYLWSVPTIAYGIVFFVFGGVNNLSKDIAEGNLDIYLTKPKNSLISTLTSDSHLSAMGDILFGVVAGIISTGGNPLKMLMVLILSIVSSIALLAVSVIIRLFAFWMGDITNACHKYTHSLLITLTIYPEQMFPGFIKVLMYTAIPAMYIAHIPVRLLKGFSLSSFLILIAVTAILVCAMFVMYNKGLKKYESGNNVTRR